MTNPFDDPQAWDYAILNGVRSPGLVKVEGFARKFDWKVMAPPGTFGGALWLQAVPPAKGSLICTIFSKEQWEQWQVWAFGALPELPRAQSGQATARPKVKPMAIYHPSLTTVGVSQVVFEGLEPLRLGSGPGQYVGKINLLEYLPPIKAVAKAAGPIPNVDVERRKPQPTARTEQDNRLAAALKRNQEMRARQQ